MKLKSTLFAGVLVASLAAPAFANDAPLVEPLPQFSAAETQMLLEQEAMPMQLATLSQQEMKDTEGAWWPVYMGGSFVLYNAPRFTQFGMNMMNTSAYQPLGHAVNWINTQRVTYWPNSRWW